MTIKRKILSYVLILCMLMPTVIPTAMAADGDALSFGNASSATAATVTLSPTRVLALLTGETISEAEGEYLDRYCDRILTYYDRIPADRVQLYSRGEHLQITAKAYTYMAENGASVTWIPREVVYADRAAVAMTQKGASYEAELEDVSAATSNRIGVIYACELSIPASIVNELTGFVYHEATSLRNVPTTAEYTARYAAACAAYEAYLRALDEYADAKAAYDQYLLDRAAYEKEKKKYDDYVAKKADYDNKKAAYDQYLADLSTYAAAKLEYDRLYKESTEANKAYREYLENINRIRASMTAIESLFEKPAVAKTQTLYKALQNAELVTMFERYRDELVRIYGVSDATLTHLRKTSDDLNDKLHEYAKAREISEEAAFSYYLAHYEEISHLFNYLYDSMREIMTGMIFNHICAKMELEYSGDQLTYKKWRVKNVLAHIYLICQALDDAETADGTFDFYADNGKKHTYYFSDLLDQNLILTDTNNANPEGLMWLPVREPVTMPTPPTPPTPVENPVAPHVVAKPTEPPTVAKPTEPARVSEPKQATDTELARYAMADRAVAIVAALRAGTLRERARVTEAQSLTVTTTLIRPISFGNGQIVTLYNVDGEILDAFERTAGDVVPQPSRTPSYSDVQYTYEFAGFATDPDADPNGLPASFTVPSEGDLALYAIYRKTLRQYRVTFDPANGDTPTAADYAYGTTPTPPANPTRAMTRDTVYTFIGWSPSVTAVKGAATYVAQYRAEERLYTLTWITPSGTTTRREPYNALKIPTPPTLPTVYYEGNVRYDFIGWDQPIAPIMGDATYEAKYRRTVLADCESAAPTVTPSLGEYTLTGTGERTEIGGLLTVASTEAKRVTLDFSALAVSLDAAAVLSLRQEGVASVALLGDTAGGVGIGFYGADGHALMPTLLGVQLRIPYTASEGATPCVLSVDAAGRAFLVPCAVEGDMLVVEAMAARTYRTTRQYALSVKSEGGTAFAGASRYFAGDQPSLTTYPAPNHLLSSVTLTNDLSGETLTLESLVGFTMPAYPATLTVTFVPKTYTVTFICRGEVVSEGEYELGATVKVPSVETDFVEDGYRYTFIGWSTPVGTVTEDATYTAKFYSIPLDEMSVGDGSAWAIGTVLWQIGLPVGLGVVAITVGIIFLVRWSKKKKTVK